MNKWKAFTLEERKSEKALHTSNTNRLYATHVYVGEWTTNYNARHIPYQWNSFITVLNVKKSSVKQWCHLSYDTTDWKQICQSFSTDLLISYLCRHLTILWFSSSSINWPSPSSPSSSLVLLSLMRHHKNIATTSICPWQAKTVLVYLVKPN